MRLILLPLAASCLLCAQQLKPPTVKQDRYPLRAGCSDGDPVLARLKRGDPVQIRFALAGSERPCYAVSVEAGGQKLQGYVGADGLDGIESFDQARRQASRTGLPQVIRPRVAAPAESAAPETDSQPDGAGAGAKPKAAQAAGERGAKKAPPKPSTGPNPGQIVPEFAFAALDQPGGVYNNEYFSGRTYLIDFWASWSNPSVKEMPYLQEVYERFKFWNFDILSVSFDENVQEVAKFRQSKWRMPWLHAFAAGGFAGETAQRFEVGGLPTLILVDGDGKVIARGSALRGANLEKTLARVLAGEQ
ncbi:MAG TPA: TlpA disulfide reductase family protein [Bryobacterales bacterium]|nr:TlpA disulfide reductase family protein [Bryobacterales bacterium]